MDKTSLETSSGTLFVRERNVKRPRHIEHNYVPLFGVTQSNVDLLNYVPLFGMAQSNVELRIITSDFYLNIVVSLDCY